MSLLFQDGAGQCLRLFPEAEPTPVRDTGHLPGQPLQKRSWGDGKVLFGHGEVILPAVAFVHHHLPRIPVSSR